jgi:uncharacterized protein
MSADPIARGRWALITGASGGIGAEFARQLAARGMNVVLCARRGEALRDLGASLQEAFGVETVAVRADLARPGAAEAAWIEATEGRTIDLLVNNAGTGAHGRFDEVDRGTHAELIALNCSAVVELAHLALRPMLARGGGAIVNVASVAAFQPVPSLATYAASKAFVRSFSRALSAECRGTGVRVLCLAPGSTPTGFQRAAGFALPDRQPGKLDAREVVAAALRALDDGADEVVPGWVNRVAAALARLAPTGMATRAAGRMNAGRGTAGPPPSGRSRPE